MRQNGQDVKALH